MFDMSSCQVFQCLSFCGFYRIEFYSVNQLDLLGISDNELKRKTFPQPEPYPFGCLSSENVLLDTSDSWLCLASSAEESLKLEPHVLVLVTSVFHYQTSTRRTKLVSTLTLTLFVVR